MKWINPYSELIRRSRTTDDMYEDIETAGRICYKSVGTRYFTIPNRGTSRDLCNNIYKLLQNGDLYRLSVDKRNTGLYLSIDNKYLREDIMNKYNINLTELYTYETKKTKYHSNQTSYEFTQDFIRRGHLSVLEFGTVYLKFSIFNLSYIKYIFNKYSRVRHEGLYVYVTTNYRVIVENKYESDMKYFVNKKDIDKFYSRPCVHFVMDRAGSQSVERHRGKHGISFAQESTRYCNYSKERFRDVVYIIPQWIRDIMYYEDESMTEVRHRNEDVGTYVEACEQAEQTYMKLTKGGLMSQDSRGILPLDIKTEFMMCAYVDDWKHFFELRTDSHAHPDIRYIATNLHENMRFKGILE